LTLLPLAQGPTTHGTDADALAASNPRLLPQVAHDRAGFGGALISDGLAVLGAALWGFRRRSRWLWWTLCGAGLPGFGAALGVHAVVGYDDAWHRAHVAAALALYAAALALAYPYLCARRRLPGHTRK
jgi:dihydroorotate dehydrogenase